jgi:hypothetical protein
MKRRHPEDDLQRAVAQLLDLLGWRYCHCPNGGARNRIEAARFKGLGVKPGVPDLLIFERWETEALTPGSGFGVAIELKSKRGRVTEAQHGWLNELQVRGWFVGVCRSVDEVLEVIKHVVPRNGRHMP